MGGRFELFALALLLVIGAYSEIEASIGPQALESTILSPRRPDVGASHRRISGVYRSRKLQIANEQAACTVQVGGTSNTFSACTALAGLSSAFRFSWTYDIASRTLHGALQGSSPTGYFALGLSDPSTPTKMAGSNAIVVQQDTAAASGASVVGYNLPDYFVQPGLVGLKLLSSKAAASATMLAATFSMVLPAMYTASALNIIYAHGDVGSDGTIQQHTFSNSLAGGAIDLTAGATTTATAATANQPSTAAEATPSSPTTILPSVAIAVVSPPTPAPPTHSAAPASAASCTATIGGKSTAYSACTTLPANFNGVFKMFWSLETVASVTLMHVAFSGPSSDGYVGWGTPASAGRMIGGNAVIVYPLSAAPTGAKAADYYLGGYSTSSVTNPGKLSVVGAIDAALNSAQLITAFTLNLTTAQVANLAAFDVIYVIGSLNSDGTLGGHPKSYGMGATIDLSAAQGSAYVTAVTSGGINSQVHGAVSAVFVGLFMPLAMVFARNFKEYSPMWFHVHRIVGILAFLGTIAGVILGFQITLTGKLGTLHEVFGIAVMSLATLQVSSLLLRPTKEHSLRWVWEFGHHLSGRTAIALGIANVYIGLHMKGESIIYYAIYSVLLGAILAVGFSKEVYDGIRSHRSEMSKSDSSAQIITEEERSDNLGLQMQKLRE